MSRAFLKQNRVTDPLVLERINSLIDKECVSEKDKNALRSIGEYYKKRIYISERQHDFLKSLESKYSEERIKETKEWEDSYDEKKRELFNHAVEYYSMTNYYSSVVFRARTYKDFIPTKKQFIDMTENKYFKRAFENFHSAPKYSVGDLVIFRKSSWPGKKYGDQVFLIEDEGKPAYNSVDRAYYLMLLGTNDKCQAYEGDIKIYRPPKKKATDV